MKQKKFKSKEKTTGIGVTGDTLTGRGGLALYSWCACSVSIRFVEVQKGITLIRPPVVSFAEENDPPRRKGRKIPLAVF